MKAFRSGPLLFVKWQSSRIVYMMSTLHDESMQTVRKRGKDVSKPSCVIVYNSNMGAVDCADQMLQPYATQKTQQWYKKVMLHLLQVSLLNTDIAFRHTLQSKMDFLTFQHEVITSLLFASQQAPERRKQRSPGLRRWFDYKSVTFHILFLRHRMPPGQAGNAKCAPRGGKGRTPATCAHNAPSSLHCVCPGFELFHTLKD